LKEASLEGFGYEVAEAMSCRCPVLSFDSDGVCSFIIPNETGKFYPHGNIAEAVAQGLQLMHDMTLRNPIRSKGTAHIHTHFNSQVYCITLSLC
jgi:glycosyltransferase involved in cell wall biosynthesis